MVISLLLLGLQTRNFMNGDFESGLSFWKTEGKVAIESSAPLAGKNSLRIEGKGAARRKLEVGGLRILYFGATLRSEGEARIRLQCLDKGGKLLLEQTAGADPKKDAGIYLKTHAFTASVALSVEKEGKGSLLVDNIVLREDETPTHAPTVSLDAAMRPFWRGDTVNDESVLLLSERGGPAKGRLMTRPARILSVSDGAHLFHEGDDYTVEGDTLVAKAGSAIPTMRDSEFATGEYPWTTTAGRHVFVTYDRKDAWTGPVPVSQSDLLPETTKRLENKEPLTVVAHGDSITLGTGVSLMRNAAPYLPAWPDLFAHELAKRDPKVKLYNTALGGMTSYWAKDSARDAVASLDPDLVVVAFGMNDFWSVAPEEYRRNVEATMAAIRKRRPKCEFLLVAPIPFDPAYTANPTYTGNLAGYAGELRKLVGKGVAMVDMTALGDALYRAKGAKSLGSDPMHPDDFLARVYAQAAVAALSDPTPLPKGFLAGGDPSEIPEVEASGAVYRRQGEKVDPFVAMKQAGWNFVRFRVWNGGLDEGKGGDWCDKAHTLALARRAKAQGLAISLDFHYSDWWADPGKQNKPAAWKDLPFDELVKALHDYTKDVVGAMVAQGTPPIMVQIGNEITPGMLWPEGRNDTPDGWHRLAKLVEAGCKAVKESGKGIKTMVHLDRGGDNRSARWWFDHLKAEGVDFDLIGLSYYPWWHGPLSDLETNLADLAKRYDKDVYVVETSYPWEPEPRATVGTYKGGKLVPEYPASPEGQAAFVRRLIEIVRNVPESRGKGLLYWAPTWIGAPGRKGGWSGLITFDHDGNALPGFEALGGR